MNRWFVRAIAEDEFNKKIGRSPTTILADNPHFDKLMPYVGRVRYQNISPQIYLTSFYTISADIHKTFIEKIMHYL